MQKMKSSARICLSGFVGAVFLFPILMIVCASFMGREELAVVFKAGAPVRLIPYEVTFSGYAGLLFKSQTYMATFWNSMIIALAITFGQTVISVVIAFLLAKVRLQFSGLLLFLYIVTALMPFQVTLLPNYILSRQIGIFNTWWTLILPGMAAPFGVFLLHQFIRGLPDEMMEAAVLETGSLPRILFSIVVPMAKAGVLSVMILAFAESWNMVEQPLVLLKDEWLYPLSLALNGLKASGTEILFPGAVLFIAPMVMLYTLFEEELVKGLSAIRF